MEELSQILKNNRTDDITWFCSLSESELGKCSATKIRKHHWLLEQKLLNFVDAFHQYVMDRVYHTAWRELCEAMVKAASLDEVIYVHETYLLSIQQQCFVVQEKLVMDH